MKCRIIRSNKFTRMNDCTLLAYKHNLKSKLFKYKDYELEGHFSLQNDDNDKMTKWKVDRSLSNNYKWIYKYDDEFYRKEYIPHGVSRIEVLWE